MRRPCKILSGSPVDHEKIVNSEEIWYELFRKKNKNRKLPRKQNFAPGFIEAQSSSGDCRAFFPVLFRMEYGLR